MADRRLRESGGPAGGTTGGYIDSFENMPGAQNQPFGAKPTKAFIPTVGLEMTIEGPEFGVVSGIVCDVLGGPLHEAACVVRIDRSATTSTRTGREVTGTWLVVEPTIRWSRSGDARVEVRPTPAPSEPWLDTDAGSADLARYTFD